MVFDMTMATTSLKIFSIIVQFVQKVGKDLVLGVRNDSVFFQNEQIYLLTAICVRSLFSP